MNTQDIINNVPANDDNQSRITSKTLDPMVRQLAADLQLPIKGVLDLAICNLDAHREAFVTYYAEQRDLEASKLQAEKELKEAEKAAAKATKEAEREEKRQAKEAEKLAKKAAKETAVVTEEEEDDSDVIDMPEEQPAGINPQTGAPFKADSKFARENPEQYAAAVAWYNEQTQAQKAS